MEVPPPPKYDTPMAQLDQHQPLHSQQQSSSNVTVVTTQPAVSQYVNYEIKPDGYLCLSIFSCICCCWILGLIAIVYSCQVDSKWEVGDYEGAHRSSNMAKKWSIAAIITGIVLIVINVVISGISAAVDSDDTDCTQRDGRSHC